MHMRLLIKGHGGRVWFVQNAPPFSVVKITALLVVVAAVAFIAARLLTPSHGDRIRVLITDGHSNHDWKRTTALVAGILRRTGLFAVDVSTAPSREDDPAWKSWCPRFSDYDVVIQNYNDMGGGALWPEPSRKALEEFVSRGGGLFILHSANNAFPRWKEYDRMIGMGWRPRSYGYALKLASDETIIRIPPGEGAGTTHGKRTDRVIHRLGDDPVHAGMPREWLTPRVEVYTHARGPAEGVTVLSWAEEPNTHEHWPVEWTIQYGKGRVYNSTFGHVWKNEPDPVDLRCVGFQTVLIRAMQWLAHRPVIWPIPSDFPNVGNVSLRPLQDDPGPTP